MASFIPAAFQNFKYQLGSDTDIGGGRENQDACFLWKKNEHNLIVLGVLDGHGREVGKIAAEAAKRCLINLLDTEFLKLLENPVEFLVRAHELAHDYIRDSFKKELEALGFQVEQTQERYLMKRKSGNDPWSCVHGGTSCTLVAIVNQFMFIANVGDSSALLCCAHPIFRRQFLHYEIDASMKECTSATSSPSTSETLDTYVSGFTDHSSMSNTSSHSAANQNGNLPSKVLILSSDHSPESPYEFNRLRRYRCRDNDPQLPALTVVYDSPTHDKSQCYAIFPNPTFTEPLVPSNRGSYYKNVRREWASLVATPKTAKFQDALAFTRSLGDLHLHTYGVTHLPEIQRIDLSEIFQVLSSASKAKFSAVNNGSEDVQLIAPSSSSAILPGYVGNLPELAASTICLVLATDGVWDNWLYEDIERFMFDDSCLNATTGSADGAQRIATSFMKRNSMFSKKNFGNQADNATGIVMYLSFNEKFCDGQV